jgi:hypothetical protein
MAQSLVDFNTTVDSGILSALQALAAREEQPVEALVAEAFRDLIAKRRTDVVRPEVMAAHRESHEKFGELYRRLAD